MENPNKEIEFSNADKTILKSIFGAIPLVGNALDEVVFEHRGRIKQDRINAFVEGMAESMKGVVKEQVDEIQFNKEQFSDFVESLLISVSKTNSKNKLAAFQNLLKNQILKPVRFDYADTLVKLLTEINDAQISLLFFYNGAQSYDETDNSYRNSLPYLFLRQRFSFLQSIEWYETEYGKYYSDKALDLNNFKNEEEIKSYCHLRELENSMIKYKLSLSHLALDINELEESHFKYLINDLFSKGLLWDEDNSRNNGDVRITVLGKMLINSIKGDS